MDIPLPEKKPIKPINYSISLLKKEIYENSEGVRGNCRPAHPIVKQPIFG
jgi:hypothetical protein